MSATSPITIHPITHPKRTHSLDHRTRCVLRKGKWKIRGSDEYTYWYTSESETMIKEPPSILRPKHTQLYVHRANNTKTTRIWMYFADNGRKGAGRWERIRRWHEHPSMEGYVLHLLQNGEPRWVKEGSARNYAKLSRRCA